MMKFMSITENWMKFLIYWTGDFSLAGKGALSIWTRFSGWKIS
jgi:hypothetical protein